MNYLCVTSQCDFVKMRNQCKCSNFFGIPSSVGAMHAVKARPYFWSTSYGTIKNIHRNEMNRSVTVWIPSHFAMHFIIFPQTANNFDYVGLLVAVYCVRENFRFPKPNSVKSPIDLAIKNRISFEEIKGGAS